MGQGSSQAPKKTSSHTRSCLIPLVFLIWCLGQWLLWKVAEEGILTAEGPKLVRDLERYGRNSSTTNSGLGLRLSAKDKIVEFGEPSEKKKQGTPQDDPNNDLYIVFSTDCSGYQHWQGILLYYSALRVQQNGTIIRIASGCSPEQQASVAAEWSKIDPSGQKFRFHFAPSTALNSNYKYSNKPGGLLHWLQQTENLQSDTVVCLLDPDMILLKPVSPYLVTPHWTTRQKGNNYIEYVNEKGKAEFLRVKSLPNSDNVPEKVTTGHAAGQHFGVGGAWTQGMTPSARPVWKIFSKALVCGAGGACTTTSSDDAAQIYGVGPVYLATVQDWHQIASTWWEFVPRVHQQYPYLLAEMYALTMAVAHLQIPFSLFSSYMVTGSDVGSPTEGWKWIDDIVTDENHPIGQACPLVGTVNNNSHKPPPIDVSHPLPTTLHHCQRYKLDLKDSFLFAKRKIPHDVFSCGSKDPVPFDMQTMIQQATEKTTPWSKQDRRTLFALCHAVPIMDWARKMYHHQVCAR